MTAAMVTLGISIIGLAALIGLKWWELRTRRVFFYAPRLRATLAVHALLSALFALIPTVFSKTVVVLLKRMRHLSRIILAASLLKFEQFLERTLHIVRHK